MDEEDNTEKCIICSRQFTTEKPKIQVGEKGIQSLLRFSKLRKNETIEKLLMTKSDASPILIHKDCRRDFTDIKRSLKTNAPVAVEEDTPTKRLRSSIEPCNWKTQCFLCGKNAFIDKKNPARKPIHQVTYIALHRNVLEQSRKRNDSWGDQVYTRLNCSNDLVAVEGRYHKMCLQRFMTNKQSPYAEGAEKGRPVDEGMQQWFQMLCIWLEIEADAELYTLQELHSKMTEMAGDESVYSVKRIKQKLQEKYGEKLYFAEIDGRSNVVCFQGMVDFFLNDLWQ